MGTLKGKGIMGATIRAKVTRADGTVEDLGVIASYKEPWWKTQLRRLFKWLMS